MRIQSSHHLADRGLDAYFTPVEAVYSLLAIESGRIPISLWEPAAGAGAIVRPLRKQGFLVQASDVVDYGLKDCEVPVDYLHAPRRPEVKGIITNPPYRLALEFAKKAIEEVPYVALLLRTNFLESTSRMPFFCNTPPARIWISSRRLPMMHRHGWTGAIAPSNTCFAWFIWDAKAQQKRIIDWFDWACYFVREKSLFDRVKVDLRISDAPITA